MQIRVPTGDCRVAVGKTIEALSAAIAETRTQIWDQGFEALHDGAVHNGLDVSPARKQEMRDMVDRDVEHMMSKHPGNQTLEVLNNFVDMLAYHREDKITLDDSDFHLLKDNLPR